MAGLLPALVLAACAGGLKVSTEHDRTADFSRLHAYRWKAPPEGFGSSALEQRYPGGNMEALLQDGVNRSLEERGFVRDSAGADFTVTWAAGTEERTRTVAGVYSLSMGPTEVGYDEGALILEITNARTGVLIWRGVARDVLEGETDAAAAGVKLEEAVVRMLAAFPPRANGKSSQEHTR
jgi:hypothetical protein